MEACPSSHSSPSTTYSSLCLREKNQRLATSYASLLGMRRIPTPVPLASRGGCWFASESVQLHLGVEQDFRPARKAHPAIRVSGYAAPAREAEGGWSRGDRRRRSPPTCSAPTYLIPFGNRIELIAA